jgi:aryl-alcohol dehydrogenase-like predicted oxidoreductase
MEFRKIGGSELSVSAIGLGCNGFGGRVSPHVARALVTEALDNGINFFDTADIYGNGGGSETILGDALVTQRRSVVIATKFGRYQFEGGPKVSDVVRHMRASLEASLRRLRTDYIDLFQLHGPVSHDAMGAILRELEDLVGEGKVRYFGCCNLAPGLLASNPLLVQPPGANKVVSVQSECNLLYPSALIGRGTAALGDSVSLIPFMPLGAGVLTGKYRSVTVPPADSRMGVSSATTLRYLADTQRSRVEMLTLFARERGRSLHELAIAWLLSARCVASVIAGAARPGQVDQNAKAGATVLLPTDVHSLNGLLQNFCQLS